jgi:hypothetical protein
MFKEVDALVAQALRNKQRTATAETGSREEDISLSNGAMVDDVGEPRGPNDLAGLSEPNQYAMWGGFCPDEEQPSQSGQEPGVPDYSFGGGFCLSEDEQDRALDEGNGTSPQIPAQSQQGQMSGGGLCLSDEDDGEAPG